MKTFRYAMLVSLALMGAVSLSACAPNYSNGSRVGVVTKLSNKGVLIKSWEGELNMGGMRQTTDSDGNSQMSPNVFTFNADPSVVPDLEKAMDNGSRVRLTYHQWAIAPPSIDNDHVIVKVEVLK